MNVSPDTLNRFRKNQIETLTEEDFFELKKLIKIDSKMFIQLMRRGLSNIRKKTDIEVFFFIFNHLRTEMTEISAFLSKEVRRILKLIVKHGYYLRFPECDDLIRNCGDLKMVRLIHILIHNRNVKRILSHLDIYKLKKAALDLNDRIEKRKRLRNNHLDITLAPVDLDWVEGF